MSSDFILQFVYIVSPTLILIYLISFIAQYMESRTTSGECSSAVPMMPKAHMVGFVDKEADLPLSQRLDILEMRVASLELAELERRVASVVELAELEERMANLEMAVWSRLREQWIRGGDQAGERGRADMRDTSITSPPSYGS